MTRCCLLSLPHNEPTTCAMVWSEIKDTHTHSYTVYGSLSQLASGPSKVAKETSEDWLSSFCTGQMLLLRLEQQCQSCKEKRHTAIIIIIIIITVLPVCLSVFLCVLTKVQKWQNIRLSHVYQKLLPNS